MVKIITKYDYENRVSPGINFQPKINPADRSLTNQADMDSADINKIMNRYEKTGVLIDPMGFERKPTYGDFTTVKNYHEMMIAIRNAENAFNLLPANIRARFKNDPQNLIDFLEDRKNDEEAIKLGLREKPPLTAEELERVKAEEKRQADAAGAASAGAGNGTVNRP